MRRACMCRECQDDNRGWMRWAVVFAFGWAVIVSLLILGVT